MYVTGFSISWYRSLRRAPGDYRDVRSVILFNLSAENRSQKFDYIFTGAGCAALSLLMRMIKSGRFSDKKILLVDKTQKNSNDRTWCFWEKEEGFFEPIVYKKWSALNFFSNTFSSPLTIDPYQYKMVRGIDFYNYCFDEIKKHTNIEIIYAEVNQVYYHKEGITLHTGNGQLNFNHATVFNSIYNLPENKNGFIYLLQHFKGWVIETEQPSFDPREAVLMDFRVSQSHGPTFAYVLPFSETMALVEYTLFTGKTFERKQYDEGLKLYIRNILKISDYKICEEEVGVIPMTNTIFHFHNNGVYYIGTAGGQTKASSGYTFQFIQKQSKKILDCLIEGKSLQTIPATAGRFRFYDTVLLRLLAERKLGGDKIFSRLFQRNKASLVFKFLDNETSIPEELKLISTLPTIPFLKAAISK